MRPRRGRAFAAALALSLVGGVALGALLGMGRLAGAVFEPILSTLYALPKVTLYPVVLLVFGLGLPARVAFGVMHGLVPLALFTMNAILHLRPVYRRTARALRLPPWQAAGHGPVAGGPAGGAGRGAALRLALPAGRADRRDVRVQPGPGASW